MLQIPYLLSSHSYCYNIHRNFLLTIAKPLEPLQKTNFSIERESLKKLCISYLFNALYLFIHTQTRWINSRQ